jgi:GNAT superfamily N-acetyltransferase
MIIRFATAADAKSISELNDVVQRIHAEAEPRIFKTPSEKSFPESEIIDLLGNPNNVFLIALEDDLPIGYIFAEYVRRPESSLLYRFDRMYIHQLVVWESHHGKGCGKALIDRVLELAKREGMSAVVLDVWSFNEKARRFFSKRGFTVFNERMWINTEEK